jgi:hypothetical protein
MILSEAISLLTSTPGSLVYHLTLATDLALLFGIAHMFHVQSKSPLYNRWRLAAGGLLGARLILMIVAGAAWLLLVEGNFFSAPNGPAYKRGQYYGHFLGCPLHKVSSPRQYIPVYRSRTGIGGYDRKYRRT